MTLWFWLEHLAASEMVKHDRRFQMIKSRKHGVLFFNHVEVEVLWGCSSGNARQAVWVDGPVLSVKVMTEPWGEEFRRLRITSH